MSDEKRKFTRINADYPVILTTETGDVLHGRVVNISLKGILIYLSTHRPLSGLLQFSIGLEEEAPEDLCITGEAEVVRQDDKGEWGLHLLRTDVESLTHLRRLVELNLGDSDQARSEIANW